MDEEIRRELRAIEQRDMMLAMALNLAAIVISAAVILAA